MFFRKKPVVIEARQFITNNEVDDKNMNDITQWIMSCGGNAIHDGTDIYIETLEGTMRAMCKDWIIKGVDGEFYPCKPDIFDKTYEEAL